MNFEVRCSCGHLLQGIRTAKAQRLTCSSCQGSRLILGISPFTGVGTSTPSKRTAKKLWFWPVVAAGVTLPLVAIALTLFLFSLSNNSPEDPGNTKEIANQLRTKMKAGKEYLKEGGFFLASKELTEAEQLAAAHTQILNDLEKRQLTQWRKEAELLVQLLQKPLEEVVREAQGYPRDNEWQARFDRLYKSGAVLFDDVIRIDAQGDYQLQFYQLRVGNKRVRVELPLNLFSKVEFNQPRRVIFGARLESIHRGPGGAWVVRFSADGGVFLTEQTVLQVCGLVDPDPQLKIVLEQQKHWLSLTDDGF